MRLRQLSVCAGPSGARPQTTSDFSQGTVIGGRYEVDTVLGRGGNGVTYRCTDSDTGRLVAVKALSLRSLRDWKQLELFQREAQILENLDHPGIPQYIDAFEEDTAADRAFFLVQELAAGESLEDMVERGWRADESEITRIATELLGILQYLSTRRPAVVHRDIKPSNIVIEGGRTGGRVFLVDFGGVQAAAAAGEMPSSTVVGTYGFMAPEQFRGAARPASDLYGLGATLLYLLSGRPPQRLPCGSHAPGSVFGRDGATARSSRGGAARARRRRSAGCRCGAGHPVGPTAGEVWRERGRQGVQRRTTTAAAAARAGIRPTSGHGSRQGAIA